MRCMHCEFNSIEVEMNVRDGHRVTLRACGCTRRWYRDGQPVPLTDVIAHMPTRAPRRRRGERAAMAAASQAA